MTAISLGFFLRGVSMPSDFGSSFSSVAIVSNGFIKPPYEKPFNHSTPMKHTKRHEREKRQLRSCNVVREQCAHTPAWDDARNLPAIQVLFLWRAGSSAYEPDAHPKVVIRP